MLPVCLGSADAVVVAGGARFGAHAALLAAHSGYFRAALRAERDSSSSTTEDGLLLYAPSVSAQQFWSLLAYMYTGYLELTPDNCYQVLLASHLLHMPRALDLCRTYLATGRVAAVTAAAAASTSTAQASNSHTIVKPIPSRKLPPFLAQGTFAPVAPNRPLGEGLLRRGDVEAPPSAPEAEIVREESNPSAVADAPKVQPKTTKKAPKADGKSHSEVPKVDEGKKEQQQQRSCDKVIVDVACCDGPVRFHRVLNDAYKNKERLDAMNASDSEDSYVEIEEEDSAPPPPLPPSTFNNASLQRQMNENIRMNRTGAENHHHRDQQQQQQDGAATSATLYTCVYCNHTFKSQYCYQKHARRHLNPVSIDAVDGDSQESKLTRGKTRSPTMATPRREVKLLDMNVQYYPCKTCGSKFPSYYFVHKHRKMCHAEEAVGAAPSAAAAAEGSGEGDDKRKRQTTTGTSDDNEDDSDKVVECGDSAK